MKTVSKPVYVGTKFLSLVNKDQPVKNILITTNIHYIWNGTDFESVILYKSKHLYEMFIA